MWPWSSRWQRLAVQVFLRNDLDPVPAKQGRGDPVPRRLSPRMGAVVDAALTARRRPGFQDGHLDSGSGGRRQGSIRTDEVLLSDVGSLIGENPRPAVEHVVAVPTHYLGGGSRGPQAP